MNRLIKASLALVFLCLVFAHANADTSIKFGGPSIHTSSNAHTNSFHRTFIVSHENYFAGYFRNSFDDDSFTAGYTITEPQKDFDVDFHFGAVWGYRKSSGCYKVQRKPKDQDPKILCPMFAPEVVLKKLPLKPSIAYFGFDALVLHLNLGF